MSDNDIGEGLHERGKLAHEVGVADAERPSLLVLGVLEGHLSKSGRFEKFK